MVAGTKTQSVMLNTNLPSFPNKEADNLTARNLGKSQLGGVIFGCKNNIIKECLSKQLFGLPHSHFSYVRNIYPGLPLFLFNYSNRKLLGVFEAASFGDLNINPYAWTSGSERTLYPAQVQIRVRLQCEPLSEGQFKPIIKDNYYGPKYFWFELDHAQANKLMSLFASFAVAPSSLVPQDTKTEWRNIFKDFSSSDTENRGEALKSPSLEVVQSACLSEKLDFRDVAPYADGLKEEVKKFGQLASEVEHPLHSSRKSDSMYLASSINGDNCLLETHLEANVVGQKQKDLMLKKLKELANKREHKELYMVNDVEDSRFINQMKSENRDILEKQIVSEGKDEESPDSSLHYQAVIVQLINGMEELKAFKTEQTHKIVHLEQKLVEAQTEIQRLKTRCTMLEFTSKSSAECVNENTSEPLDESRLDPTESIFLVGGYDGESWLAVLDSYFPSKDVIKSYMPMSCARSYTAVTQMNGEFYVLGGGSGLLWYDTVESYDPTNNKWTRRPSLKGQKGSLAAAISNNKIFAIGGGNGVECFSEVEMLDLDVGDWVPARSMSQKRFALAAVELNGVVYATGGYDGNNYLNTVERFDSREHSWTRIASMNSKRSCHALVVLNEKLYAMGGFDGNEMVSSVEVFDPRIGSWMNGEPMNQSRGYSAVAVLKDSIYVIGGVEVGADIIDTVEHYKEGQGWQEIYTSAIGKRCFASAFTF